MVAQVAAKRGVLNHDDIGAGLQSGAFDFDALVAHPRDTDCRAVGF